MNKMTINAGITHNNININVIPVKTGIQNAAMLWILTFVGMTLEMVFSDKNQAAAAVTV